MTDQFIIKKPWITEKAALMGADRKYVFLVREKASKPEIKKAIRDIYKVDVTDVNVVNRPAKSKRYMNRRGVQEGYRKAIVTLKEGQKIDLV
ncbi:MAG TPA: 50S ribosomal protein L23 [Candidatus Paceibacterota bacterium]|nr:50S ribosomal protein L23 [Candidatus Paceibacterota bacterium]